MKLKKFIAILLCCMLSFAALAFTACDGDSNSKPNRPPASSEDDDWTENY